MDHISIRHELERFDPSIPIESAWMPPASWYIDPDLAALEERALFQRTWQPVLHASQVASPGSYATGRLLSEPWLVTRDADGALRAFHNVCRHKGREVVTDCGRASELVCGYHAWKYTLEGALASAPRMAGVRDFDRTAMSLPPQRAEVWGPWVFINGDPDATPLIDSLGELDRRLTHGDWHTLRFVDRRVWHIGCNWKVYVDNYLDGGYHIPHMHPTLDAQLDMESYRTELFERCSIQSSAAARSDDQRIEFSAGERIGDGALYAWMFPNFMLNRYGPCLDTNWVLPTGPDSCDVLYEFYFSENTGEEHAAFIAESMEQAAVTQREDIAICESVQAGLRSSSYDRGRYAPGVEIGEYHFHRMLANDLSSAVARPDGNAPDS